MTTPTTDNFPSTPSLSSRASRVMEDGFCNCECMLRVNKRSKALNDLFQRGFYKLGLFVGRFPYFILSFVVLACICLMIGFQGFTLVTDVFDLWTPRSSPYYDERIFYDNEWSNRDTSLLAFACRHKDGFEDILDSKYVAEYFDFHLHLAATSPRKTYTFTSHNGTKHSFVFSLFGETWKEPQSLDVLKAYGIDLLPVTGYAMEIIPLCNPWVSSPLEAQFELSCYSLDIFHCFSEGGYMFPYENYLEKTYFTSLIPANPYLYKSSFQDLSKIELGSILGPSCKMWADNLIPSNYIYGGETRINESDPESRLLSVRSFETLLYLDSPFNLVRKIKMAMQNCTYTRLYSVKCPEPTDDEMNSMADFVNDYLHDFIEYMLDYLKEYERDETHLLKPLFFTSRTSSDLLTTAFSSNLYLLAIAYILMIIFASCTGCRPRNLFFSRGEASFAGTIIVVLSVLGSMGLGAAFWSFSPNVIQVLPFVAAGLGVDDMFVMLQSFHFDKKLKPEEMVAKSLEMSGASVSLTTLANFLAFLIASFMPLPDVNRFAQFGMVMVALHYISVIFGFTAVLGLLARRMTKGYNDYSWLCCWRPFTRAEPSQVKSQQAAANEVSVLDPLFDFMTRDDIRIGLLVVFCTFFGAGLYGVSLIHVGLPLDSIIPASYGQDYLQVRGKYYHSYVTSLYTDGYRDQLKPINWSSNFELWVNETKQILDVDTELIYQNPNIHSFWAWSFSAYNKKNYFTYFNPEGYTATHYVPTTSVSGKSSYCETYRLAYCSSLDANYTYLSKLYQCLWENSALLNSSCLAYLESIIVTSNSYIAKQIEVYSPEDESVAGVYSAPSSDATNIFYRSDGATLFQRLDNSWAILDLNNQLKYKGLATDNSPPSQYGWTDSDDNLAPLTIIYYDTTIYAYGAKRSSDFKQTDDAVRSKFVASVNFEASNSNSGACNLFEVLRKGLSASSTFSMVRINNGTEDKNIQCGATIESTNICSAISSGQTLGPQTCGSYEHHGGNNRWWVGNCNSSNDSVQNVFTIAASTQSSIDTTEGCFCTNPVATIGSQQINSYVQFCGNENFGGFNINANSTSNECSKTSQTIAVECNAVTTCNSLEVCFEYVVNSSYVDCTTNAINVYEATKSISVLALCLLPNYDSLTTCCQQAVQSQIIAVSKCKNIGQWSKNDATVCAIKDSCDSSCKEICYKDVNADCRSQISKSCESEWTGTDESAFVTCMNAVYTSTSCCNTTYPSQRTTYQGCLLPTRTYYDYNANAYNYSDCSSSTAAARCGSYNATAVQLQCMLNNRTSVAEGCCRRALNSIAVSYVFTKDCDGDVEKYCGETEFPASISSSCETILLNNRNTASLSPNCNRTLLYCPSDGTWPLTLAGKTATLNCSSGYIGTRTRQCIGGLSTNTLVPYWSDTIDVSQCNILYCPATIDGAGQEWPRTKVGNVASWFQTEVKNLTCLFSYAFTHRYCSVNAFNIPVWSTSYQYCKPIYLLWKDKPIVDQTCNATSSMIFTQSTVGLSDEVAISQCQNLCLLSHTHCDALVYNNVSHVCTGYDWCVPKKESGKGWQFFEVPATFPEWMASDCAETYSWFPSKALNTLGTPYPPCFNTFLWEYVTDPQGGATSLSSFQPKDPSALYSIFGFGNFDIVTTSNTLAVQKVVDDSVGVKFIVELRNFVDDHLNSQELWVVLHGLLFDLDTQYIKVTRYFVSNLLLLIIAVMFAGLLFLIHPLAACVVLLVEVVMVIEVYGFVDWADLHMNGVLTLNMLVAVGLTMEFAAHIARSFMLASARPGEKIGIPHALPGQIRMKKALREMFTPVTLTAITTFIGIAPIASASFPYFRDYYFVLYVMMILTGWVNGAVFQPVILSFLNPGTFSHENDRRSNAASRAGVKSTTAVKSITAINTETDEENQDEPNAE